jgi:tetratricopeptide (TPR) repeat protein
MKILVFLLTFALIFVFLPLEVSAADHLLPTPLITGPTGNPLPDASAYLLQAKELVARRNWAGAAQITREAITYYPEHAGFRCINGYALRKLGQYPEAIDQVSQGIALDPQPVRYANRGYAYLALGNYSAARADAESGIAINAAEPVSYLVEALALEGQGRPRESLHAADEAIRRNPGSAHAWHVKGIILAAGGNCTGAQEALERSVAIDPGYDLPWPGIPSAKECLEALNENCTQSLLRTDSRSYGVNT